MRQAGKKVADIDDASAGDFEFYSAGKVANAGLIFRCPCGCGRLSGLNFKPLPSPSWQWDGNEDAPTLTPSVHSLEEDGSTHWHGYLRAGIWESV